MASYRDIEISKCRDGVMPRYFYSVMLKCRICLSMMLISTASIVVKRARKMKKVNPTEALLRSLTDAHVGSMS